MLASDHLRSTTSSPCVSRRHHYYLVSCQWIKYQFLIETPRCSRHSCLSEGRAILRTGLPPTFCRIPVNLSDFITAKVIPYLIDLGNNRYNLGLRYF